jgi:hypothetical protein
LQTARFAISSGQTFFARNTQPRWAGRDRSKP